MAPENQSHSPLDAAVVRWVDESSTHGVFITDTGLVVRSWNEWLERVTGRKAECIVGKPLFEVLPEIVSRGFDNYFSAALRGEVNVLAHRFHAHLVRVATATGDMPQSVRIAPLVNDGVIVGTICVIEDVSERVNSEAELRRQIAAAEQARATAEEALRVKDEFLATLSHELRTPLNAVLGWTNILLGHTVDSEMLDRALRVIDRNASAQARLIDDMLDMARIVTGKLRLEMGPVDLVVAALAAIDVVTPAAEAKNLTIRTNLGPHPRLINADADRVQQIAWNVLSNAVKFTPSGGTVDVSVDQVGNMVRLVITDSGKGITPEFLPHVFERFRQANSATNRTEGGLGLGLALVRQLVEMHGGQISVASEGANRGSTFTVTFPAISEVERPQRRAPVVASGALEDYRIIVVDDDRDWCDLMTASLRAHGADVICVGDARSAFESIIAAPAARPDLLIADIGLPEEDGYTLIARIRELNGVAGRIPAIAVTAYAGSDDQARALASGFDAWRAKPIRPEAVAGVAIDLLKTRRTPKRLRRTPAAPVSESR